jgi:WD40 repeat protein
VAVSSEHTGPLRIWRLTDGTPLSTFELNDIVTAMTVWTGEDDSVVVYGDFLLRVRARRLRDGALLWTGEYEGWIKALAVGLAGDEPVVVGGGPTGLVRVWRLVDGTLRSEFHHGGPVEAVELGEVGGEPLALSGESNGTVCSWRLAESPSRRPPDRPYGLLTSVSAGKAYSQMTVAAGEWANNLSADRGGVVRTWSLNGGIPLGVIDYKCGITALAIGEIRSNPVVISSERAVFRGKESDTLRVRRLADAVEVWASQSLNSQVSGLGIGVVQGEPVVVSGGRTDGQVRAWRLADGGQIWSQYHVYQLNALAVGKARNESLVISGGSDGTIRVCRLADGTLVWMSRQRSSVNAVAMGVRPRRRKASTANLRLNPEWGQAYPKRIESTEMQLGVHDAALRIPHQGRWSGAALIVSGGEDGTVCVWQLRSGPPLTVFDHGGPVNAVAVGMADKEPVVISGGEDGRVCVWRLVGAAPYISIYVGTAVTGLAAPTDDYMVLGTDLGLMVLQLQ